MGKKIVLLAVGLLVLVGWVLPVPSPTISAAQDPSDFVLVVHRSNPVRSIASSRAREIFLKETEFWPDGVRIEPVDLLPSSPVRQRFSERVLGRPARAIRNYWYQQLFSGLGVPPSELDAEAQVIDFVSRRRGAIGYVSPGSLTSTVDAVFLRVDR